MSKASINFKVANDYGYYHIGRDIKPDYLIDDSDRNEYNRSGREAYEYHLSLLDEAVTNYFVRTSQSLQVLPKKLLWEAVVNLQDYHTLADVKKLVKYLEKKYKWQEVQIAIHRDEGHVDEVTGKKVYNFHAHILFFMLSADGLYRFKKNEFGKKKMSLLQSEVADLLGMERGESKLKTRRERLNPTQYRQEVKEREDLEFEIKRLVAESEMFEDLALREHKEKLKMLEDFDRLKVLIATLEATQNELENQINKLQKLDKKKKDQGITIPSIL